MRDLVAVLIDVADVFASLRIRYVIVGGVAATLLGRGRSTFDVDVVADLRPEDAARIPKVFRARGFRIPPEDIGDALQERTHFSVHDTRSTYRVDCKGVYSGRERWTLSDRRRVRIAGRYVYVDAPENLIAVKLQFGSEQDVLDAEAVYARQRTRLDLERIRRRAAELRVTRRWIALRRRVERILREGRG